MDNVPVQVIERHYLSRDQSPARCFSPQWVGTLSVDELDQIAGEERSVVDRRAMLTEKLEKWKGAKRVAGEIW